jgi:hypothetical protein
MEAVFFLIDFDEHFTGGIGGLHISELFTTNGCELHGFS